MLHLTPPIINMKDIEINEMEDISIIYNLGKDLIEICKKKTYGEYIYYDETEELIERSLIYLHKIYDTNPMTLKKSVNDISNVWEEFHTFIPLIFFYYSDANEESKSPESSMKLLFNVILAELSPIDITEKGEYLNKMKRIVDSVEKFMSIANTNFLSDTEKNTVNIVNIYKISLNEYIDFYIKDHEYLLEHKMVRIEGAIYKPGVEIYLR